MERHVCDDCQAIHYQNPKIVAGALLTWENRILLARRAIEPRDGYWTLPAGFMENGETVTQAAAREAMEETLATSHDLTLYGIYNLPYISQVYVMYLGTLAEGRFGVGAESRDARLYEAVDIPWNEIAFPVIERTLRRFLADRDRGTFGVFEEEIALPRRWRKKKVGS